MSDSFISYKLIFSCQNRVYVLYVRSVRSSIISWIKQKKPTKIAPTYALASPWLFTTRYNSGQFGSLMKKKHVRTTGTGQDFDRGDFIG